MWIIECMEVFGLYKVGFIRCWGKFILLKTLLLGDI